MLFLGPTQAQVASDTELFHALSSDTMFNLGFLDNIDIFLFYKAVYRITKSIN